MKSALRAEMDKEMKRASAAETAGDLQLAFRHLERAHILGQRYFLTHMHAHLCMLRIARRQRNAREIWGQALRLLAVAPGYLSGWVPKGNTGGANVSALKPMRCPDDLAPLLKDHNVWRDVGMRVALVVLAASAWFVWLDVSHRQAKDSSEVGQRGADALVAVALR